MDLAVVIPVAAFVLVLAVFLGAKVWFMRRHDDRQTQQIAHQMHELRG